MKISPIDIRQHTFEKGFRGYNIDEVNAFLNSLSQEWERVINENKMLKMQLEIAEKELNKLKDIEMTLFRTLKTAEDTSQQITEQANKAAEKYLGESRQKSDETVNEAKRKASMLIQDAENEAKYIKEEIVNELKNQERDFKAMEKYRDNLVVQLKSLVNNTQETVDRFEKKFNKDTFALRVEEIKKQVSGIAGPQADEVSESTEQITDATASTELSAEGKPDGDAAVESVEESTDEVPSDAEVAEVTAEVPSSEEANNQPEAQSEEVNPRVSDAASDARAEIEKMANARKKENEDEPAANVESTEGDSTTDEENKGKGSFFDQIR